MNGGFQLHAFVDVKLKTLDIAFFGLISIVCCLCKYSLPCSTQLDNVSLEVSTLFLKKTSFSVIIMMTIFNEGACIAV